ncbi:MAG TPA: hypothetical protein VK206_28385 [Anaerolineales bacterium]|nr:hypothetical protein [Anaerolineales bacterium]
MDENTYIDDSLVTCAEYQLFIDEMRVLGIYCQPDHWTSDQFSANHALEPILGVRHSDAIAFCEWLTQRESADWTYRLSYFGEAIAYPINGPSLKLVGYWVTKKTDDIQFVWTSLVASKTFELYSERILKKFIRRFRLLESDVNQVLILKSIRNCPLNLGDTFYQSEGDNRLAYSISHNGLDYSTATTIHHDALPVVIQSSTTSGTLDIDYAFDRTFIHDKASAIHKALENLQAIISKPPADDRSTRSLEFIIYLTLFILRERVAGRSPAFEGIRLVKERK